MAFLMMNYPNENIVRFPVELRRIDLDALMAEEPDFMDAEALCDRCGVEIPPVNFIECGEDDARVRIAALDHSDPISYRKALRRMNEQAITAAISQCRQAREAEAKLSELRERSEADRSANPAKRRLFDVLLANAERTAANQLLSAIAAADWARGIDEVVSRHLVGDDTTSSGAIVHLARPV